MTPTPNGLVGYMFFEELLRRFFVYSFGQISKRAASPDVFLIDELFASWGDEIRLQVRQWFIENTNIACVINYPRADINLPQVAVVNSNETEKTEQAYLSDDGGMTMLGSRSLSLYGEEVDDTRGVALRRLVSVPEQKTTQIYIMTNDVNTTLYLYTVVKALVLINKLDFDKRAGARNMKMSGADLQRNETLTPEFAYQKLLTLNYEMNFDVALPPEDTIKSVGLTLKDFLGNDLNA